MRARTFRGPLQGTAEWLEVRRGLITGTDLPVILGISPWKSEAELADEKMGLLEPGDETPQMRMGKRMEDPVREEYELQTGERLRHVRRIVIHGEIPWAGASLDFDVVGKRKIVECKVSGRREWEDGVPLDVEAQVQWQMGVAGYPEADVAVWWRGEELRILNVQADPRTFAGLVEIAADFRARLQAGGPFQADARYAKRRWPSDNGAAMSADEGLTKAYENLVAVRASLSELGRQEADLEGYIKNRMGEIAEVRGSGWRITWKKSKESSQVDWAGIAAPFLASMQDEDRATVVAQHTTIRQGSRRFVVTTGGKE